MKTFKKSYLFFLAGFLAVLLTVSSCGNSSTGPDIDDTTEVEDPTDDDSPGDPIDPPPSDNFKIDSDDVTETEDGYRFNGSLIGINGNGVEFSIGEGEFEVELDTNGAIVSISGIGLPEFPDMGIYKDLLEEFAWDKIESHIEYKIGSEYIADTETDIPLNPDRYYVHFRVFDENRDGKFELRRRANDFIYDFYDMYIDIDDPAVFIKVQVPIPDGDGGNADDAVKSFWKKLSEKALEKGIDIGENIFEVSTDTYMIIGLSNEGTFTTPEYSLSEFGLVDTELFSAFNGFENLSGLQSHIYLKFARFPIPGTYQLLNITGDMSTYSENDNKIFIVDLLVNRAGIDRTDSYTGEISFSAPGLGLILEGILPSINEYTGRDIFGTDIDLSPIEGFYQYRYTLPQGGDNLAFMRFGGSFNTPVLADIFGENIKQYLFSPPTEKQFGYFNIGPGMDETSFYVESNMNMIIPSYGEVELGKSVFNFNSEGIYFLNKQGLPIGPFTNTTELEGSIYAGNYNFRTEVINDITLPNNVILGNKEFELSVSSDSGATFRGQVILPFDIGEASTSGELTDEGLTMSGMVSQGSELALTTGLNLPTRDLELTVSTDPDRILELQGETQIPFVGYNQMTGIINQDQFLFEGEVDRTLSFGSLEIPVSNGSLLIDSQSGVFMDASYEIPFLASRAVEGEITNEHVYLANAVNEDLTFSAVELPMSNGDITLNNDGVFINGTLALPHNLRTSNVYGSITSSEMKLTGSMASELTFYGVNFPVTNSTLTASTNSGVSAAFNIKLNNSLNARVTGNINQNGYVFTGSNNFSRGTSYLGVSATVSGSIATRLTQNGISLTANGSLTYKGALGNTITVHSGNLTVQTDWQNRSISVCVPGTNVCVGI
ncbi:hypothetical protein [Rhodohalobacter sp.]|uniref:hypothetical protein n=1 Tax=Rhodohalobacter sp. TaxID=1974210 RepID=UPI002ACE0C91|nr:hypothetical protein [Rhodohalobacter sp.]MDZ7757171.1 hypothetical protein [Rhodohalobacter sp.]